jgi:hypothetical protein
MADVENPNPNGGLEVELAVAAEADDVRAGRREPFLTYMIVAASAVVVLSLFCLRSGRIHWLSSCCPSSAYAPAEFTNAVNPS